MEEYIQEALQHYIPSFRITCLSWGLFVEKKGKESGLALITEDLIK